MKEPKIIDKEDTVLVVIDLQEKLIPHIVEKEKVIKNVALLIDFCQIVKIPFIFTQQKNLGLTIEPIRKKVFKFEAISKVTFNCFESKEFVQKIKKFQRKTLILTGLETHICILQTALTALKKFDVQVVADAVSSRSREDKEIALERMKNAGVTITSTEMFIFEILKKAETKEFKLTLPLLKS